MFDIDEVGTLAGRLLAAVLLLAALPAWAGVQATVDRNPVFLGDGVTLTIEADAGSAPAGVEPDLSPLGQDFEVRGTSSGRQIRIVNGQRSDTIRWSVRLEPKRTGSLVIPPIRLGGEQTRPIELTVKEPVVQAGDASAPVHIEVDADIGDQPPYVQQQIRYTVRLYLQRPLIEGELTAPNPENAVVEQLGEQRVYQATRNGRPVQVIERNYAIFPEASGDLYIPPLRFNGRIVSPRERGGGSPGRSMRDRFFGSSSPFDRFFQDDFFRNGLFDDDFFSDPFRERGVPVALQGKEMVIPVRPRPGSYTGRFWLPAEEMTIEDSWEENPPTLKAGEPVTRTITIEARGLEASQIPAIDSPAPDGVRAYPERPETVNGTDVGWVVSRSEQKTAYVPSQPGEVVFPEIRLDWWDTRNDRQRTAVIPARTFRVAPGAAGSAAPATPPPAAVENGKREEQGAGPGATAGRERGDDAPPDWPARLRKPWPWLALAAALLAILVGRKLFGEGKGEGSPPAEKTGSGGERRREKEILRELERACSENDAGVAGQALLDLAAARWPDDPPGSLGALADRLEGKGELLRELERTLYAENPPPWKGAPVWKEFAGGLGAMREERGEKGADGEDLAPLYPS